MTDDDLDLVETGRLVDALKRRFDVVIMGTLSNLNKEERGIYWRGGLTATLGILSFMDKRFTADMLQQNPEPDDVDADDD